MLIDKKIIDKKLNYLKHEINKIENMDFSMEQILKDEDIQDIFLLLGKNNVISKEVAEKFASIAGFRNILVHEYADIDYKQAYSNLDEKLKDLKSFAKEVLEFLEKQN